MKVTKLDVILEEYNEESYPQLKDEIRYVAGFDDAIIGVEDKTLRIIYCETKFLRILQMANSLTFEEVKKKWYEIVGGVKGHTYAPMWMRFGEGFSFDDTFVWSEKKYPILIGKRRVPTGLDNAYLGFHEDSLRMVYSCSKAIQCLMDNDEMTYEEAEEFLEVNTFGYSNISEYQPIWCDDRSLDVFNEDETDSEIANETIFLAEWESDSKADNPNAFKTLDAVYDFYQVPQLSRVPVEEIAYLKYIEWKPDNEEHWKIVIVRVVELKS